MAQEEITVQVADRRLKLSNLDKVLYPRDGFTKAAVISYYTRIAPVLLPHLKDRPVTFVRYPNGVTEEQFFEKNVSPHAPSWVRTVRLTSRSTRGRGEAIDYPMLDDLPALVWAANLAALELHVPQWTIGHTSQGATPQPPDRLVFDLDPGAPATIVECCRAAERLREILVADGLTPLPKTSGSKGLQVYCAVHTSRPNSTSAYARSLAEQLARETPDLVVSKMTKSLRRGKVFVDWSQNNPAKTTIAPYSLRGRERPTVSTPVDWDEVRACHEPDDLVFTAPEVLDRVAERGDLFAGLADTPARLPES